MSVAFSVGVSAVGGLIVQLVIPLDRPVWATLLALVTLAASVMALERRDGMPADTEQPTLRIPRIGLVSLLAMLAAVAIGGWAIAIATEGAHGQASEQRFSSLWLVPAGALASILGGRGRRLRTTKDGPTTYQPERRAGRPHDPAMASFASNRITLASTASRPRRSPARAPDRPAPSRDGVITALFRLGDGG